MLLAERAEGTNRGPCRAASVLPADIIVSAAETFRRTGIPRKKSPNENGPGSERLRGR